MGLVLPKICTSSVGKKIDVALVMCDDYGVDFYSTKQAPSRPFSDAMSLQYLVPPLQHAGLTCAVFNPYREDGYSPSRLAKEIVTSRCRAIGISVSSYLLESAALLSSHLKMATGLPIVVGGYVSLLPDVLQHLPAVDVLFQGEGEIRAPQVFWSLIDPWHAFPTLPSIAGLVYRTPDGLKSTGAAEPVSDIDPLWPNLEIFRVDANSTKEPLFARIYAARGCYARCSYCEIYTFQGKKIRRMSGESVVRLIGELHHMGVRHIDFTDDDFLFGKPGRLNEIASVLRETGIKIKFQTRATDVLRHQQEIADNRDVIYEIHMGLESFSQSQLDRWNKNTTVEQNLAAARILTEFEIPYFAYLIFMDKETTFREISEQVQGILKLPPSAGIPYALTGFSYIYSFGNPFLDLRGRDHLSGALARCRDLLHSSSGSLRLSKDYCFAYEKGDEEYQNIIWLGAVGLLWTAGLASLEDHRGELAAELHRQIGARLKLLRLIKRSEGGLFSGSVTAASAVHASGLSHKIIVSEIELLILRANEMWEEAIA